jgi:uncharacterized integral membrane protein
MHSEHFIFTRIVRFFLVICLVGLVWFSLSNADQVALRWVMVGEWVVPMMLVILSSVAFGWLMGVLTVMPSRLLLKRKLKHLLHLSRETV